MEDLILAWRRLFGETAVDVRHLIEAAEADGDLAAALLALLGPKAVDPQSLRSLLSRHENQRFADFRVARAGNRFRVAQALTFAA